MTVKMSIFSETPRRIFPDDAIIDDDGNVYNPDWDERAAAERDFQREMRDDDERGQA